MRKAASALAVVVLGALVACSDDDGDRRTTDTTGPPRVSDVDQELVEGIVLTSADLPDGWMIAGEEDEEGELELGEDCADIDEALGEDDFDGQTGRVESDTFVRGNLRADGGEVRLVADVAAGEDPDVVAALIDILRDDRLAGCVAEALGEALQSDSPEGLTFGPIEASTPTPPDVGDDPYAFHIDTTLEVEDQGFTLPIALDVLVTRVGRVGMQLIVSSVGEPVPASELADLLAIMVERAAAAG